MRFLNLRVPINSAIGLGIVLVLASCGGGEQEPEDALALAAAAPESAKLTEQEQEALVVRQAQQELAFEPLKRAFLTPDQVKAEQVTQDSPAHHVRSMGDFDGDGKSDPLWQGLSGSTNVSLMNGVQVAACGNLQTQTDTVMGTGDFNGDGKADIVWRNMSTGTVRISLMDGGEISRWLGVGVSPIALNVKLEGIGDFDGNGRADMLWRNQSTGRSVMSYHNTDGSVASWPVVSNFINPANTTALKVGDINGDGKDDIIWRNMSSGNVVVSIMNGNVPAWRGITASPISPSVALEAMGDFDGNGKADLLWRNTATGRSLMSYHNADGSVASWPVVSNYINPYSTSAVGVGDFDGDGKSDILWRNLSTGNSVVSLMNGNVPTWNSVKFSFCPQDVGRVLPVDPGTGAAATVQGIDSNLNGVRDEVERTLSRNIDDDGAFAKNTQVAALYQQLLNGRTINTRADAVNFYRELFCLREQQTEAHRYGSESGEIAKLVFDTEQRRNLIRSAVRKLGGGLMAEEVGSCAAGGSGGLFAKAAAQRYIGTGYNTSFDDSVLVLFVNGIWNENTKAASSSQALMGVVGNKTGVGFTWMHNPRDGYIDDVNELVAQIKLSLLARDTAKVTFDEVGGNYDKRFAYMKELGKLYEEAILRNSPSDTHVHYVKALATQIRTRLEGLPNQNIVLVPHSQGNFMVEGALSYLYKMASSGQLHGISGTDIFTRISVAGFASVAATTHSNNYVSGEDDAQVFGNLSARALASGVFYLPLDPNARPNPDAFYFERDIFAHGFVNSYLSSRVTDDISGKRMNVLAKERVDWSISRVAPQVTAITPTTAVLGLPVELTVTGTNLPSTALLTMSLANCSAPVNRTRTGFRQTCTPNLISGIRTITVLSNAVENGGSIIDQSRTVSVSVGPAPSLPHTGITVEQCFQAGTNSLVACNSASATSLNSQQDGHRIKPRSYSAVGSFPLTSCVRDNGTGLVWEGKEASGARSTAAKYTNYLNDFSATNSLGYVNYVNSTALCGYSDWRIPTVLELLSIVNFGTNPAMDTAWFPNSPNAHFWTADSLTNERQTSAWYVSTGGSSSATNRVSRSGSIALRLVRGSSSLFPADPECTQSYAQNVSDGFFDARTGLTWALCTARGSYNANDCTGPAVELNHEEALIVARINSGNGWRLPSVTEAATGLNWSCGATPDLFSSMSLWSSTPSPFTGRAYAVSGMVGVTNASRTFRSGQVHLVRDRQ